MAAAFAIHLVHVLAMAVIVGGTVAGAVGAGSRRLEWLLWGAVAAIVVTGVGNVGRYGEGLPGPTTAFGAILLAKLLLVLAFLGVSLRRSTLVWKGLPSRVGYHASAGIAAVAAAAGVWLAHG